MSAFFATMIGNANLLDAEGLEANRRGEITESQNKRLNFMVAQGRGCGLVFAAAILGFFLCTFSNVLLSSPQINALIPIGITGFIFLGVALTMGGSLWKMADSFIKLRRDRQGRAIRQAQGQLAFNGKSGYVFETMGRQLVLPSPENTGGLLPGATYRVYFLDESGFVLSAEEMVPASPAQVRMAIRDILAHANQFTTEDLEHNRNGETTAAQRMKPLGQAIFGALFGLIALPFAVFFFFNGYSEGINPSQLPTLLIPMFVLGVFFLVGGWMFVNAILDMFSSSVAEIEGPGHKEKRVSGGKNRSTRYYYVINGQSFQVNRIAYTALIDNLDYRVYYLPRTKKIVSIEPVDVTPDVPQYNFNA